MYIIDLDSAKRFHEAAIIDSSGKVIVKRIRFANSHDGFVKLMDAVRVYVIKPLQTDALRNMFPSRSCVDMTSDFKRKILALVDQIFPEYENLFSDIFGKSFVELLANYTTPEEMLAVDSQKLAYLLNKASRAHYPPISGAVEIA